MANSAIIIAESADQRREIVRCINPLGIFDQLHFCATLQEVRFLLDQLEPRMIFCGSGSVENEALRITASLASLAKKQQCPLVFFSSVDRLELLQLGILPPGSNCLNKQIPSDELKTILQLLLNQQTDPASQDQDAPLKQRSLNRNPGLHSRFSFNNFLNQERSRSQLTGRPFSLLLIEPQPDKSQSYHLSHWDTFLPTITMKIKTLIRDSDLLCRVERQQLALLLPETSTTNAHQVIDRIQSSLSDLMKDVPFKFLVALSSLDRQKAPHFVAPDQA